MSDTVNFIGQEGNIAILSESRAIVSPKGLNPMATGGYDDGVASPWARSYHENGKRVLDKLMIAPWGGNNLQPLYLLSLLAESNINAQLIYTKVSFAVAHMYTFRWGWDADGNPIKIPFDPGPQINRFLNSRQIRHLMRARATDFFITGNCWVKIQLNRGATQIAGFEHVDASSARLGLMQKTTKRIPHHFVCADWAKPKWQQPEKKDEDQNIRRFQVFREEDPFRAYLSTHHSKLYWTGQPYYGIQPWHSGHQWIHYGNRMPVWMTANINKAHNIKYHIEYPKDYFAYLDTEFDTPKERKEEKARVFKIINDTLSGAENAQATFYSFFSVDKHTGKKLDGWSIKPISNDLKDDAFVKSFYASNVASVSAMGVDPALAGIQLEGRMPASGSDKRISYQLHEVLKTDEAREIMTEPLELWRDINGLDPDMQFGFLTRNIVTLAEDSSGMSSVPNLEPSNDGDI